MTMLRAVLGAGAVLAGLAGAPAAMACPHELPLHVRTPTANASALQRVAMVRVIADAPVRDLHVLLEREGRTVARGSRGGSFVGGAAVRLAFRRAASPGRARLVVTGLVAGCDERRTSRREIELEGRDLPLGVTAGDVDVRDGSFEVTVLRRGQRPIANLRARVLDERGVAIAEVRRRAPLATSTRLVLTPQRLPARGRHWLLATATVGGGGRPSTVARPIRLQAPVGAAPGPAPVASPEPQPDTGSVVQHVAVAWSGGRWQGSDAATFAVPGIGRGELVCRPDTQWLRIFPADRSRDVSMMLWTARDWETGGEVAIREAQLTPFTGPDFNEGLNKFTPTEHRSHGSFVGVVGDGLPALGTFGPGRSPTEVRLTWSWDLGDPQNARCDVQATLTSEGSGTDATVARGLSLRWRGDSEVPADLSAAAPVPGLGTVQLRCEPGPDGLRELVIAPQTPVPALVVTTYEGSDRRDRTLSGAPYVVALPNNGLVEATTPAGAPLRLLVASRWKVNDPDPAENSCRLSAIVVAG
ncbi:MAG: hypothetical protein QOG94_1027 [Solirubrobacteraceae bacterium]|nr:hypothetical protein [Solirubrobacteraceae bacterium]